MKNQSLAILLLTSGLLTNAFASGTHGAGDDNEGSAVGQPASASQSNKIIHVTADDNMRYQFSPKLVLTDGDTVKFIITNKGKIAHEFSIGDAKEQKEHQAMMRKMPNMTHQDGNTVMLKAGETKEITWKFKAGSEVIFACNVPGHFEAGMFAKANIKNAHGNHIH